mgnify:CR=1 FL=1
MGLHLVEGEQLRVDALAFGHRDDAVAAERGDDNPFDTLLDIALEDDLQPDGRTPISPFAAASSDLAECRRLSRPKGMAPTPNAI